MAFGMAFDHVLLILEAIVCFSNTLSYNILGQRASRRLRPHRSPQWPNACKHTYPDLKAALDEWRTGFLNPYAFAFWDKDDTARIWYDCENVHDFWGRKEKEEVKEVQRIMLEYR
ncbi:hypothetical protein BDZ45DRAFT_748590 [Acephala macrosclerotiorum]|nr:hypothetical protein BDZ45DRAFT_748590 [Acephala macrosclerotiorum]